MGNAGLFSSKPLHVVLIGLDNAGKTTLLLQLKLQEEIPSPAPTTAFNVETVRISDNARLHVWDTSGTEAFRPLWKTYVRKTDAIVFVIDSADEERFDEAKVELEDILDSKERDNAPVLILANKQDDEDAVCPVELARKLHLDSLASLVNWHLHPCSASQGRGVDEAIRQLATMVADNREHNRRRKSGDEEIATLTKGFHATKASQFV